MRVRNKLPSVFPPCFATSSTLYSGELSLVLTKAVVSVFEAEFSLKFCGDFSNYFKKICF